MASVITTMTDDEYDNKDIINNYIQYFKEEFEYNNYIYIYLHPNFSNVPILTKILKIFNQNTNFIEKIIINNCKKYFKINISKRYTIGSFEYQLIKDSIAYTINFSQSKSKNNYRELLYMILNDNRTSKKNIDFYLHLWNFQMNS